MTSIIARVIIVALVAVLVWLAVVSVRRFIDARKKQILGTTSLPSMLPPAEPGARVRILAFSSEDCRPCHTLQRPALDTVSTQKGDLVDISWIDAPSAPDLTQHYHVMTVPTTVVLDTENRVQAINYGFAPSDRLLEQIDAILAR
jgi:thioredoxin 1